MKIISVTEARAALAEVLNRVCYGFEDYLITSNKKERAVLIPPKKYRLFLELLERYEDELDRLDSEEALEEARREGTVSHEELKAELGLD